MPSHAPALRHLRAADPALARVIERVGACRFQARADGTHLGAVARAIVFQQLSGKAASTIHGRFEALFGGRSPTAAELLATPDETLRGVGLSRQKTAYLKDLAARVVAGELPIEDLHDLDDDAVLESLVRVKGVGRWTAQIFLMFRLGRPDVMPELDLGVQKGLQLAYGLKTLPKPREVAKIAERWAPYRTVAAWYLWRLLDNGDGQAGTLGPPPATTTTQQGAVKTSAAKRPAARKKPTATKKSAIATRAAAAKKRAGAKRGAKRATTRATTTTKRGTTKRATTATTATKRGAPRRGSA
jgi:DNA-3-methyladenine glycosylase II